MKTKQPNVNIRFSDHADSGILKAVELYVLRPSTPRVQAALDKLTGGHGSLQSFGTQTGFTTQPGIAELFEGAY